MDNDLQLCSTFKCWVQTLVTGQNYSETLKQAFLIDTIKDFWKYYQHMKRPSRLNESDNIYLFKKNVHPSWEDPANKEGGCLKIRLRKARSNRQWEDLLLAIISPDNKCIADMNGIRLKIKEKYDQVEIWLPKLKTQATQKLAAIKDYIKRAAFHEDDAPVIEYKSF